MTKEKILQKIDHNLNLIEESHIIENQTAKEIVKHLRHFIEADEYNQSRYNYIVDKVYSLSEDHNSLNDSVALQEIFKLISRMIPIY